MFAKPRLPCRAPLSSPHRTSATWETVSYIHHWQPPKALANSTILPGGKPKRHEHCVYQLQVSGELRRSF
jgi:hypothetical protein